MTFSLAGRCGRTGQFGVVVSSSSPAVAARCAHVAPGVGAACSQNITDPRLGPLLLRHIGQGLSARAAMSRVVRDAANIEFRQLTVIDANGDSAFHNGSGVLGTHAAFTVDEVVERFPDFTREDLESLLAWLGHAALIRPIPAPEWDES